MDITIIPILKDNYAYILRAQDGRYAVVDPGEAAPILEYCHAQGIGLDMIINTHHHGDHVAGNAEIKQAFSCPLAAPAAEADKIGAVDIVLREGQDFNFGGENIKIIETPGHTLGHICLYLEKSGILLSGDTLFSLGCGRIFEGDANMMWDSLQKLAALPDNTLIYCGHEYTLSNSEFCLALEPDNPDLITRIAAVKDLRARKKPSLPVTLGQERKTNVFLRCANAADFAKKRAAKDSF